MSLSIPQPSVAVLSRDEIAKTQVLGGSNDRLQHPELSATSGGNIALDRVDDITLAAPYQEDINPASGKQQGGQKDVPDAPAFEESAESRLERLGRMRPQVFHSIWSEIGFVFSISMSQVLSVILTPQNDHSNH